MCMNYQSAEFDNIHIFYFWTIFNLVITLDQPRAALTNLATFGHDRAHPATSIQK